MASLRQIRRRMKSVESIGEITKAMQMISTFRFKRAEGRFSKIRSYLTELEGILANLCAAEAKHEHPLFEKRDVKRKSLIVMTGDKGLCGAYNANLLRATTAWLKSNSAFDTTLIPVGKVAYETFKKRQMPIALFYPDKSGADLAMAKRMAEDLKNLFLEKRTDSVELLYATYKSGGVGQNKLQPFIPFSYLTEDRKSDASAVEYIYEPAFQEVFFTILEKFFEGKLYLALLESLTSEHSARMMAMSQASDNGEEVLHTLKLLKNKTRQAVITRELSEIVGGASVLV